MSNRSSLIARRVVAGAALAGGLLIGAVVILRGGTQLDSAAEPDASADAAATDDAGATLVTLSPGKAAALQLDSAPAEVRTLRPTAEVPARLAYDNRRHVVIAAATAGVLSEMRVEPGDRVEAGAILAVMNSPAVGAARADLLARRADVDLARLQRDRAKQTAEATAQLAEAVADRLPMRAIDERFGDAPLGSVRNDVLAAYGRLLTAENAAEILSDGSASRVISGRAAAERRTERETALAALASTLNQAEFDLKQQLAKAEAALADAGRRADVARQTVLTLLRQDGGAASAADGTLDFDPAALSRVEITAPLSGTIERRERSAAERVEAGEALFVLADVSTLWVSADLREREWNALRLVPGDAVDVLLPVGDPPRATATVYFVGREVDPASNAVPLIAALPNPDRVLRPGMFCRVVVPIGEAVSGVTVPTSAVQTDGEASFVFAVEGDLAFRRVDVRTGLESQGRTLIPAGLEAGREVVSEDAFALKSELLLAGEE